MTHPVGKRGLSASWLPMRLPVRPSWGVMLLSALAIAGCGDSEVAERKAFVAFLQERVIAPSGLRIPKPNADDQKAFGRYAAHYAVITEFHEGMNKSVSTPMVEVVRAGRINSLQEVLERKNELRTVRQGMARMRAALDEILAKAEAARSGLAQADDLKAVYARAFEKTIVTPAGIFRSVFPPVDEGLQAIDNLAELLDQNRGRFKLSGNTLEVTDPKLHTRVNAALTEMNAKASKVSEAQRLMQSALR